MAKESKIKKITAIKKVKYTGAVTIVAVMAYCTLHLYFLWQPAGQPNAFGRSVMSAHIAGVKIFPYIQAFDLDEIAGRKRVLAGEFKSASPLASRLASAIKRNEPVTFTEEDVNVWLRHRLQVNQGGVLGKFSHVRGVWVDLKPQSIEVIIERELPRKTGFITSLTLTFESQKNGFTIQMNSSHVGQVRMPGGFARLIMPSFTQMQAALSEEFHLYSSEGPTKQLNVKDVQVDHGRITLDPRFQSQNF